MKSEKKTIVSDQFLFQKDEIVLFVHPKHGRIKGGVLGTEYTAQSGYTVAVKTVEAGVIYINEQFLKRLIVRAA